MVKMMRGTAALLFTIACNTRWKLAGRLCRLSTTVRVHADWSQLSMHLGVGGRGGDEVEMMKKL
jgi:hypothetical protein